MRDRSPASRFVLPRAACAGLALAFAPLTAPWPTAGAAAPATAPASRPAAAGAPAAAAADAANTVRCAVIGGMVETSFWPAVVERFEKKTGLRVEVVASGPKEEIGKAFRRGGIDLITMHASDTIVNLAADGLAADPRPWLRNDMLIVGPPDDPAGVKGEPDAAKALQRIAAKGELVVHSSLGAQEVLRGIMDDADVAFDPARTTVLFDDRQRRVLGVAAAKRAYTLVGRIPFRNGKLPNDGLVAMVQGDPRLRRPYLVAVADPARVAGARVGPARQLAAFLRDPDTQAWVAGYGKGQIDDQPLFYPVSVDPPAGGAMVPSAAAAATAAPATRPAGPTVAVGGAVPTPVVLDAAALAALPHEEVRVTGRDGKEQAYAAVPLRAVVAAAGVRSDLTMDPKADPRQKNRVLRLAVVVEAADGYAATFAFAELLPDVGGGRGPFLGTAADGKPLSDRDGPVKLLVPGDRGPARSVRGVTKVTVIDTGTGSADPGAPAK